MKSRTITTLLTVIASLALAALGVLFLFASEGLTWASDEMWMKSILSNLGGLLIASASLAIFWELFSKRAFLNELFSAAKLNEDVRIFGLTAISIEPVRGPDFQKLIKQATSLDIFVCYANTWRSTHEPELKYLASKSNAKIRLIVPNSANIALMNDLAKRFNAQSASAIATKINDAIDEYKALFLSSNNKTLDFSVWQHEETPVTSFYLFNSCCVVTLYKHAKGRGNAPTLVGDQDGELFDYVRSEVASLTISKAGQPSLAKKIWP